ncbi:MAG: sugar transferase [Candidatus Neomarinimicrobiota bacterium]
MLSFLFAVIIISSSDLWNISRIFIVTFTIIMFIMTNIITIFLKIFIKSSGIEIINLETPIELKAKNKFIFKWLLPSISILLLTYVFITYLQTGTFHYNILHEQNFLVLITSWGLGTLLTNRYKKLNSINHYYEISPYLKGAILTALFITFFYYALRLDSFSINIVYKTVIIHSSIEISIFLIYFFGRYKGNGHHEYPKRKDFRSEHAQEFLQADNSNNKLGLLDNQSILFKAIIESEIDLKTELTTFILDSIQTENIPSGKLTVINNHLSKNIETLTDLSQQLLINNHKLNDCRRINEYLLSTYAKLETGGLLFGNITPLESFTLNLRKKMPHFLFLIILPFHFFLHRVIPKLSFTKQLYFYITKGRNRVISKSELLGRLAFCGYQLVNEIIIDGNFYFISKKKKTVSKEDSPSYGPIVKLKRVGYNGEFLNIYKLRTMYPYSEFIQGDIYEKYHLDKSGKMKSDFRITSWGKIFRKYFIDEIPQLYNWLKGDINFVGVRALSEHYFSLYPTDLQHKRVTFKPGLIPPYYADLPKSFDEIIESERRYLIQKERSPIITDIKYFSIAIKNILFGARSK